MNVMDSFSLQGKVALITGASYGIGFAIACAMSEAGATIVFNDIKQELVDKGLASYAEKGIKAHGYVCDVTDEQAVNAFVAQVEMCIRDRGEALDQVEAGIGGGASADWCASRGEYLSGLLLADYLGWRFLDPVRGIFFDERGRFDAELSLIHI